MTEYLQWTPDYALGIPAMDADHRELLDLCNQFLALIDAGEPAAALARSLETLIIRTLAHFRAEEHVLDRHGYPALAIHVAEHERLLREAESLRQGLLAPEHGADLDRIVGDTATFLRTWLLEHIRNNDRPYQPFLRRLT